MQAGRDLKAAAHGARTNWVVITGAPSSGKTSVIEALKARGYTTQAEVARAVIEKHLAEGKTLAEIRGDNKGLQRELLRVKLDVEAALKPAELVFMDRGMDDSITYYREAGLDIEEAVEASRMYRYRKVFIFDRLPIVKDNVRSENDATAARLDVQIEQDYRMMGYDVVRVPVMPIERRADFVLEQLGI